MIGEDGMEFNVQVDADSKRAAQESLNEDYPESHIAEIESPADVADRQNRVYAQACRDCGDEDFDGYDYDEELTDEDIEALFTQPTMH
jgi:hypothetical protein